VTGQLPKELAKTVDRRLAIIFARPTRPRAGGRQEPGQRARVRICAAASLREGLEDIFTVARLGIGGTLAQTLTTTNWIESSISIARRTTGRMTRWKDVF
jgi:putative transposase